MTTVFDGPVVIVGAGVAGLVCAQLLLEAGCEVVVVERESEIGGLARSYRYDGYSFDCGPHRFHTENPNVGAYLDRVIKGGGDLHLLPGLPRDLPRVQDDSLVAQVVTHLAQRLRHARRYEASLRPFFHGRQEMRWPR